MSRFALGVAIGVVLAGVAEVGGALLGAMLHERTQR